MATGTWEVVAQIDCPADTDPQNNQKVTQVVVIAPDDPVERSVGGALTE